jgi:diguanylate cyclase (GGDEF)-like protein/PAS domain S-box-containing protein
VNLRGTAFLPRVRLSEEAFRTRHRALRWVLWAQFPLIALVMASSGTSAASHHTMPGMVGVDGGGVVTVTTLGLVACALASLVVRPPRAAAAVVSLGLLLAAALMTAVSGGRTELHFAFFLVVGLVSLYQDWLPLALAFVLVVVHHLAMGLHDPTLLFSDADAKRDWLGLTALHAGFIFGSCVIQVVYWRFAARAQEETDRVRAEAQQALRRSAERYETLVQESSDIITVVDSSGKVTSVSAAVHRVMGYRPEQLAGARYRTLVHPDDRGRLEATGQRAEVRLRHADGAWHWHDMAIRDLSANPAVGGWVVNHRDVTERRVFQDRLEHEATHDALTGLVNRGELIRALDAHMAAAAGDLAVLYLDLDGFKQINDTYGHEAGDALLVAVARALHRCVLGSDVVGRLGGDEFAVVLTRAPGADGAITVANRIIAELARPVLISGRETAARTSIGIALAGPGPIDTDVLLHRADTAMYHAKRDPESSWRLYVEGLHDPDHGQPALEDELRAAIDGGELRVLYQPQVALETGEPFGVEALVRWQHPTRGLLLPEHFLALAEQAGLVTGLDHWVLAHSCAAMARWRGTRTGRLGLAVNLSPRHLREPGAADRILAVLREHDFPADDLTVEITESAALDADTLTPALARLRDHGVRIALDDFGTGHSSLRHLTDLPVDALKLEECFVAELDGTPERSAVAQAVIRLGQVLHLDTIAEGVETAEQARELTLLGCRAAQGFHFAPPLPEEEAMGAALHSGASGAVEGAAGAVEA